MITTATWGSILYRAGATLAGLVLLLAILNFANNLAQGRPLIPVAALGLAAIIWLIGACCRYLLDPPNVRDPEQHV
jgi:hypothetical protein